MRVLWLIGFVLLTQVATAQLADGTLRVPTAPTGFKQLTTSMLWVDAAPQTRPDTTTRPPLWVGESFRDRGIPLAQSWCYEVGKRWWGSPRGLQVFVGIMAEPPLVLAHPYKYR